MTDKVFVTFEPSCVMPDDPGEVVTHAHPTTDEDRSRVREQQLARLQADPAAVAARERRIALEQAGAWRRDLRRRLA